MCVEEECSTECCECCSKLNHTQKIGLGIFIFLVSSIVLIVSLVSISNSIKSDNDLYRRRISYWDNDYGSLDGEIKKYFMWKCHLGNPISNRPGCCSLFKPPPDFQVKNRCGLCGTNCSKNGCNDNISKSWVNPKDLKPMRKGPDPGGRQNYYISGSHEIYLPQYGQCSCDNEEKEQLYDCDLEICQPTVNITGESNYFDISNCEPIVLTLEKVIYEWVEGRPYTIEDKRLEAECVSLEDKLIDSENPNINKEVNKISKWEQPIYQQKQNPPTTFGLQLQSWAKEHFITDTKYVNSKIFDGINGTATLHLSSEELLRAVGCVIHLDTADVWKARMLTEHASIGSFAKVVLELMVHGAPTTLLTRALIAGQEEVVHAELSRNLIKPLHTSDPFVLTFPEHTLTLNRNYSRLWQSTLTDGLLSEANAAVDMFLQAWKLVDKELYVINNETAKTIHSNCSYLSRVFWAIASDEARHAELAYDTLRWIASVAPSQYDFQVPHLKFDQGYVQEA